MRIYPRCYCGNPWSGSVLYLPTPLLHCSYRNKLCPIQNLGMPMRKLIRPLAAVVYIACLAVANCVISADCATAQELAASPAVKQMAMTKKQIEGVIAAQKEMDEINEKVSEKPKPYLIVAEQLESVAKENGFARYEDY